MNLYFILNDSEAFLRNEVIKLSKEWGFASTEVKTIERFDYSIVNSPPSLFGIRSMTHLDLTKDADLKAFVKVIDNSKKNNYFNDEWFGAGLIITATNARSSKKIENLVSKTGGTVVKKANAKDTSNELLGRLKLNNNTLQFIKEYAGENYDMLLSVVNEISKIDEAKQFDLTPDELIVRLPQQPGSIPPWEFVNEMLKGDCDKAIKLYRRTIITSHPLVPLVFARRNMELLYRISVLRSQGIWNSKDIAKALDMKNGPAIWNVDNVAKRININTAERLAILTSELDNNMKGGLAVDPELLFSNYIAHVCSLLR